MSIIKGIKVGTTDITSTYVNGNSRSDTKELEVIAVSLQDIGYVESPDNAVYTGSPITPTPVVTANFDGNVVTLDYGSIGLRALEIIISHLYHKLGMWQIQRLFISRYLHRIIQIILVHMKLKLFL